MTSYDMPPTTVPPPLRVLPEVRAPGGTFAYAEAFAIGWRAFKACYWPLVGAGAIWLAISFAGSLAGAVIPLLDTVIWVTVEWALAPGLTYIGITAAREHRVDLGDLFAGFRMYGRAMLTFLLVFLAVAAVVVLGVMVVVAFGMVAVLFAGSARSALPMIAIAALAVGLVTALGAAFVYARLWPAFGLVIDPAAGRLTATSAVSRAWALTRPFAWGLYGMILSIWFVSFVGFLLLCGGLIFFAAPLGLAVTGAAYWLLTGDFGLSVCLHCGYDLSGAKGGVCPECGAPRRGSTPPVVAAEPGFGPKPGPGPAE